MKKRTIVLGAIAALAAMALPSAAFGKAHLLRLYKVEQHADLVGQDTKYTVQCPDGDLALDGMWRIDNVDQDNDYVFPNFSLGDPAFDVLRSVRPVESQAIDPSTFEFAFNPTSGGDVQVKLWVTCLGKKTAPNGHFVTWSISPGSTKPVSVGTPTTTGGCPNGIVVQPGFIVNTGDADLMTSRPTDASDTTWAWKWDNFDPGPPAFTGTVSWNCLDLTSSFNQPAAPHHRHRIVKQFRSNDPLYAPPAAVPSSPPLILHHAVREATMHCGDHYKGMVGGWDAQYNNPLNGYGSLWYLGMDPRIKSRSFKWINSHASTDWRPNLYLVCFKDKTT